MKVLRSTLVAAVAVIAAACGDKVNVVGPSTTTATPDVTAITVAPSAATMSVGQTVNFTAAVTAVNGAAATVTWSSSDASKVSISTSGVATAVAATPGVAICATSTVNVNTKGCATVVVSAGIQTVPATVSIQSITINGVGLNNPVNPAAVAGAIDVRANVAAGTETVTKIVVLVGTTRADSQTFSAAEAAALRYASDDAAAHQSAFPPVLFTINTAKFNATTGVPAWLNGNYNIAVQLYTTGSGTAARSTATYQTALTFANANTYVLTTSTTGSSATSAAGYLYKSGSINASVLPVIYTGVTMKQGTITFGTAGCDATGPRTIALTAPATGSAWTATFTAGTGAAGAGNFNGYEFRTATGACAATIATGENFTVTAEDNNGNAFVTGVAPANAAANGLRMDNVAPAAPVVNWTAATGAMPNGRALGWLNDAVAFNGLATSTAASPTGGATSNGLICDNQTGAGVNNCAALTAAPLDLGVGSVTYSMAAAATTTAATAAAATTLTSSASLAPSATNTTYCGVAYASDALGNKSTANPSGTATTSCAAQIAAGNTNMLQFGVDRAQPTIAWDATSLASNARINTATLAGNFVVTVADTGAVGNSGMLPTVTSSTSGPVLYLLLNRTAAASTNMTAAGAATTKTTPLTTGVVYGAPLGSTNIAGQATTTTSAAYWTATVFALDAAGNASVTLTRTVVGDNNAAIVTAPAVPATITGAYSAASFLNDNLSIRDYYATYAYAMPAYVVDSTAALAAAIDPSFSPINGRTPTVIDAYNAATLTNTNFGLNWTVNTYLGLQTVTAGIPNAYAGANLHNGLTVWVRDQTQAAYSSATSAVAPTAPGAVPATAGPNAQGAAAATPATTFTGAGFVAATSAAAACAGIVCVPAAGNNNITFSASATGATGAFNNPFSRVDFYSTFTSGGVVYLTLIGSVPAASATLVDNGATRVWTYTLPAISANAMFLGLGGNKTAAAAPTQVKPNIYAFGVSSTGNLALVSAALAQVIAQ